MDILWIVLALLIFAGLVVFLALLKKKAKLNFTVRILIALGFGLAYGVSLQLIFNAAGSGRA